MKRAWMALAIAVATFCGMAGCEYHDWDHHGGRDRDWDHHDRDWDRDWDHDGDRDDWDHDRGRDDNDWNRGRGH